MNSDISRLVFVLALLFFSVYVFRIRSVLLERIIFIILAVMGIFLVIRPEISVKIANLIGIGRGTDLVFYVFIIMGLFFSATVIARIKRLEQQITSLVRREAMDHPVKVQDK